MEILSVKVKPNSKQQKLEQQNDGIWIAQVKSPPIDGKTNAELIKLLSLHFQVAPSRIRIKSGALSKLKRIKID